VLHLDERGVGLVGGVTAGLVDTFFAASEDHRVPFLRCAEIV
jgi:hypothetical protein